MLLMSQPDRMKDGLLSYSLDASLISIFHYWFNLLTLGYL